VVKDSQCNQYQAATQLHNAANKPFAVNCAQQPALVTTTVYSGIPRLSIMFDLVQQLLLAMRPPLPGDVRRKMQLISHSAKYYQTCSATTRVKSSPGGGIPGSKTFKLKGLIQARPTKQRTNRNVLERTAGKHSADRRL
jgi:hypothetical protein